MTMARHVCALDGHVTAYEVPECLCCNRVPKPGEKLHTHIVRDHGEMADFRDIASVPEWGHADVGATGPALHPSQPSG